MKSKSLYEAIRAEFLASDQMYCCYCGQPQESYKCCQENHFVRFSDLYEEDQKEIINEEFDNAYKDINPS
jgi:hypothetical protein